MNIIFDFAEINKNMKGDGWFKTAPPTQISKDEEFKNKWPPACQFDEVQATAPMVKPGGGCIGSPHREPGGMPSVTTPGPPRSTAMENMRVVVEEINQLLMKEKAATERAAHLSYSPRMLEDMWSEYHQRIKPLVEERDRIIDAMAKMALDPPQILIDLADVLKVQLPP